MFASPSSGETDCNLSLFYFFDSVFNYPTFAIQQIFSHTQGAMLDSKSFYKAWHMCYFSESPNNFVNVGKSDMPVSRFNKENSTRN